MFSPLHSSIAQIRNPRRIWHYINKISWCTTKYCFAGFGEGSPLSVEQEEKSRRRSGKTVLKRGLQPGNHAAILLWLLRVRKIAFVFFNCLNVWGKYVSSATVHCLFGRCLTRPPLRKSSPCPTLHIFYFPTVIGYILPRTYLTHDSAPGRRQHNRGEKAMP